MVAPCKTLAGKTSRLSLGRLLTPRRLDDPGSGLSKPKPREKMTDYNLRDTNNPTAPMSRGDLQAEALIIEMLIDAAIAVNAGLNPSDAFELMEMAQARAAHLNRALDIVNKPELQA